MSGTALGAQALGLVMSGRCIQDVLIAIQICSPSSLEPRPGGGEGARGGDSGGVRSGRHLEEPGDGQLWGGRGDRKKTHDLLETVHEWVTEGGRRWFESGYSPTQKESQTPRLSPIDYPIDLLAKIALGTEWAR